MIDIAVTVMGLVAVEGLSVLGISQVTIGLGALIDLRHWSFVTVPSVEAVIDVAMEVCGAVEPASGSDEDAAVEPLGTIVAVGRAAIGSVVVVSVGA